MTAVTVQPTYRRLGLARKLMNLLENVSEKKDTWFVDLFVRETNTVAKELYTKLGKRVNFCQFLYKSSHVKQA